MTSPAPTPQYTTEEVAWQTLRAALVVATITPGPVPYVPFGTPSNLAVPIDDAYNAGILTGSGIDTECTLIELPNTLALQQCQRIYY